MAKRASVRTASAPPLGNERVAGRRPENLSVRLQYVR